jgi:hypothetical protein
MPVQDDARENQLIQLFQLEKDPEEGRGGTDAALKLEKIEIPFELKSSTRDSVTTVRDFGPDHVEKWKDKHWLFGFYERDGVTLKYCLYASPQMMAPWIQEKEVYIKTDFELAAVLPQLITLDTLYGLLGQKEVYTIEDARTLHKRQYTALQYRNMMDVEDGYSPGRMLEILKDRARYIIERGATLNDPHIPGSYFARWERITERHAERLRELVAEALKKEARLLQEAAAALEESAREIDTAN